MRTLETVNAMSLFENLYWSMQFGNAALLFLQLLWMWDWQKPISVVLNTLRTASDTLLHFFLNLGWLLLCYAALGHVLFGQDIIEFRSFFKVRRLSNSLLAAEAPRFASPEPTGFLPLDN